MNCSPKILGKGKGEKLHEVLISSEEKYYAREFNKYFIINSNFKNIKKNKYHDYDSGNNKDFLDEKKILLFLKKIINNENYKI